MSAMGEIRLAMPIGTDAEACALTARPISLDDLLRVHQRRVFRIALRLLGDLDEASSTTQDCFLRCNDALARCPVNEVEQQRWISRIIVNLCLDRLRSRKWRWWRARVGLPENETGTASPRTPEREAINVELRGRLMTALERLSARQRAVFVLRHYEDYPLDRIAEELNLSSGTVKAHLSRALMHLREELKEFYETRSSGF